MGQINNEPALVRLFLGAEQLQAIIWTNEILVHWHLYVISVARSQWVKLAFYHYSQDIATNL